MTLHFVKRLLKTLASFSGSAFTGKLSSAVNTAVLPFCGESVGYISSITCAIRQCKSTVSFFDNNRMCIVFCISSSLISTQGALPYSTQLLHTFPFAVQACQGFMEQAQIADHCCQRCAYIVSST